MTDPERHAREAASLRLDPKGDLAAPEPGGPNLAAATTDAEGPGGPAAAAPLAAPLAAPASEPLASVITKPRSSSGRGTSLLMALAAAIAIGGIAFAAGRLTAPVTATTTARLANGQLPGSGQLPGDGQIPNDGQAFPGRTDGFGGVTLTGTVRVVSTDSITLELATGTQVTIPLSSSTTYHSAVVSSVDAVTVGSQVSVTPGARAADPNATADPSASPGGALGRLSFGPASDVTVIEK